MTNNPLPIVMVLLLLRNRNSLHMPQINLLQIESALDNARNLVDTIDRLSVLGQSGLSGDSGSLPDIKKMAEVIENLPL